jgi:putative ATPase
MPPQHILNAPTKLMKELGYGAGYAYDHDADEGFSGADYWPEGMAPQNYYKPLERGFERQIIERMTYWDRLRTKRRGDD